MTNNTSENEPKRYTLRPTFTPLPHANKPQEKEKPAHKAGKQEEKKANAHVSSVIRAANEDDDLYDPYSDYHDGTLRAAEFEEDPWR